MCLRYIIIIIVGTSIKYSTGVEFQVDDIPHSGNLSREITFANWLKMGFRGENFRGLHSRSAYYPPCVQINTEKAFIDRYKTAKFTKVFSLDSFLLYSIHYLRCNAISCANRLPVVHSLHNGHSHQYTYTHNENN